MEPIKVSIEVKVDLSESVKNFIAELFNGVKTTQPVTSATSAAPAAPAKPAQPASTPAAAPVTSAAPAKPAQPVSAPTDAPAISIETVRQALAAKVNSHREEIKAKLNELGSPSVTKLDPAKYGVMLSFLNSLS